MYAGVRNLWPVWIPVLLQAAVSLSLGVTVLASHARDAGGAGLWSGMRRTTDAPWTMDTGAPLMDVEQANHEVRFASPQRHAACECAA